MSASVNLYLVGMGLLFIGERLISGSPIARGILALLSVLAFVAAVLMRVRARGAARADRRKGESAALILTLVGIGSLLFYALSLPAIAGALGAETGGGGRFVGALRVLWPIVWLCGTLPLVLVDWALGQMPVMTQHRRIVYAVQTGLALALAISLAFPLNYLAGRHSRNFDLRQIKTTAPGEATLSLVEALVDPLDVYLFFPPANDVHRELEPYFDEISRRSGALTVEHVDHALNLDLAEKYRVSSNGSVVMVRGDDIERINLGTNIDGARSHLRRFDESFQSRLLKLTRRAMTVYFTVGHEEMHWSPVGDEPQTRLLTGAKRILEQLNFQVSELGLTEGLARAVPDDAAAVVIAGPRKPFLPEEIAALDRYARQGGRLLLLLEPGEERHEELVALFGARYHPELIHHERHHLLRSRTKADRAIIATNRFSSHPSVGTLSRHSSQLALIIDGAGWLETKPGNGLRVSATVRSMPQSWADVIPNNEFDGGTERRETWDIGAAATREFEGRTHRSAVLAGATAISDAYLGNRANLQWLADTVRWMTDDEDAVGLIESEEDVRLSHTREKDVFWFYGTIFAIPLFVLVGGIFSVRQRRRRSMA